MTVVFVGFQAKLDALKAAKDYGLRVVLLHGTDATGFEPYVDEVYRVAFSDVEGLKAALDQIKAKENVQAVFTNYEIYTVYKAFAAQYLGLEAAGLLDAASARNKLLMRDKWKDLEANIDFRAVRNEEDAAAAFTDFGGDVYLKFVSGIKSSLIYHVRSEEEMIESFADLAERAAKINPAFLEFYDGMDLDFEYPDPREVFLVEKAEYGRQVTVASVVGEEKIWHAPGLCDVYTAKDIGRDDSFLAFRILPGGQEVDVEKRVKKVVEEAVRALGVKNCLLHSELILKDDGSVKLIEIAARVGGYRARMYKAAYDLDLFEMLFDLVLKGDLPEVDLLPQKYVSLMEIFPKGAGSFVSIDGKELLDGDDDVLQWKMKVEPGDEVGKAREGNVRVMDLMLRGDSYDAGYEKSLHLQQALKVYVE